MWPRALVIAVSVGAVYGLLALEAASPLAVVLLVWVIAILILAWRLPVKATDLAASRVAVEARSLDLRELRPVLATNGSDPFPSATRGECRHSRVISLLQCRERRHSRVWSCSAGLSFRAARLYPHIASMRREVRAAALAVAPAPRTMSSALDGQRARGHANDPSWRSAKNQPSGVG